MRPMLSCTVALKRQGVPDDALNAYVPELTDKLPRSLTIEMNKMRFLQNKHKKEQSMQEFLDFHLLTITTGNTSKKRESKEESSDPIQQPTNKLPTANFAQDASQVYRRPCLCCGIKGNHWSDECRKVTDIRQRREIVQKEGRCFKCFNKGHLFKDFKRKKPCFHCKDVNHNSALCLKKEVEQPAHPNVQIEEEKKQNEIEKVQIDGYLTASRQEHGIIMAAFKYPITNPVTKERKHMHVFSRYRGKSITCISAEAAERLNLRSQKKITSETSRFNTDQAETVVAGMVELELNGSEVLGLISRPTVSLKWLHQWLLCWLLGK
ncbi:uncharacterized protein [Apostichopus japonicus]|uniref:uncharacterized protein n=1 Tax=Stichopus japonicus TaxID=307972 RepID=UPI003AB736E3